MSKRQSHKRHRSARIRFHLARKRRKRGPPWPNDAFPIEHVCNVMAELSVGANGTAYSTIGDRTILGMVREWTADYAHLAFYWLRDDDLPSVHDEKGNITPLRLGSLDELAESTELVFLPGGVVGQLYNQVGPGLSVCERCVEEKTGVDVSFHSLLRPETMLLLEGEVEINAVEIRVARGNAHELARALPSLQTSALRLVDEPGTGSLTIVLRPERGGKERFSERWVPRLQRLAQARRGAFQKLAVERRRLDFEGGTDVVDLLRGRITVTRDVPLIGATRHVVPTAARDAILNAYDDEFETIRAAIELLRDGGGAEFE